MIGKLAVTLALLAVANLATGIGEPVIEFVAGTQVGAARLERITALVQRLRCPPGKARLRAFGRRGGADTGEGCGNERRKL